LNSINKIRTLAGNLKIIKMRKGSLSLIVLIVSIVVVTSCKKSIENKLEGQWKRVNVVNVNSDIFEYWNFSGGYIYVLQSKVANSGYDTLSYGTYTVKANLFKRYLSIETNSTIKWTIDKLTKKQLVLYRDNGGMEYREFTKE